MRIQLELITTFGIFKSHVVDLDDAKIDNFQEMSKEYYKKGLEMDLEDGAFAVFSPEVVKNSIFKINKNV
jgi:hypothetical protein